MHVDPLLEQVLLEGRVIETDEKIAVNIRIKTSVPGKKYSRNEGPSVATWKLWCKPAPKSNQNNKGVPIAPTTRLGCRKNRINSLQLNVETTSQGRTAGDPTDNRGEPSRGISFMTPPDWHYWPGIAGPSYG